MKRTVLVIAFLATVLPAIGQKTFFNMVIPTPKETTIKGSKINKIVSIVEDKKTKFANPDEYTISAKRGKVVIAGNLIWANNTIKQIEDYCGGIPDLLIHDWASYPFRAFMHDTGRNWQEVEMIKETIDLLSRYKVNYFHWHLTDDPAWRIERKKYPQLNDAKHQRAGRDEGKYYTYGQIRDVIAYAKTRGITIVPEIDMPGHSQYFKNAFGCTMDSKEGRAILEDCLKEFFEEIPEEDCPYFHIGGDEIWIEDPEGFARWATETVEKYGRKPIAWDSGIPTGDKTIRQIWNTATASNANATQKGGKFVDSFMGYLNYYDPIWFTNHMYLHKACNQDVPDTNSALGGILCPWNDVRVDKKENIALHNGMLSGLMAYAERFWVGGEGKQSALLPFELKMLAHKSIYYKEKMRWYPNSMYQWDVDINDSVVIEAYGGAINLEDLCAERGIKTDSNSVAKAITIITPEKDTERNFWIGFGVPARSNRNAPGIGRQGEWEGNGKCIVNGKEIVPQWDWDEPEKYNYRYNTWHKAEEEEPYTGEQFYWMRKSVKIQLTEGENVVEIIVPKVYEGMRWNFAFMVVDE